MRIAKSCSTCKHGLFRFPRNFTWSHNHGRKKQMGICIAGCDGGQPKFPRLLYGLKWMRISLEPIGERRSADGLDEARARGLLVEKEDYLEIAEKYIRTEHPYFMSGRGNPEEAIEKIGEYYDAWREYSDWWVGNWSLCRRCHRVIVCDSWAEGRKIRESVAKQIVGGKHGLHV